MNTSGQSGLFVVTGVILGLMFSYLAIWLCWPILVKTLGVAARVLQWLDDWSFYSDEERPRSPSRPYDDAVIFDPESVGYVAKVHAGDFRNVRLRLISIYDWDLAKVDATEREYRRFLLLSIKHKAIAIVPWDLDLDLFWQEHILDTRAYAEFCSRVLGFFLHRDPSLTSESSEWPEKIGNARNLYRKEFGYAVWAGDLPIIPSDNAAGEFFQTEEAEKVIEEIPKQKGG
ncbi:MAG: hypothetical protein AAB389_04990 [Patescibacteria group bacterium]